MSTKLTLVIAASLFLATHASAVTLAPPKKLNTILCQTEAQAIAFAGNLAAGQTEPMAVNAVNKASGAEVCGRYIGFAVVEIEKTQNHRGTLFMLAGMRFAEDGRLGWTASWISPFNGAHLERGA